MCIQSKRFPLVHQDHIINSPDKVYAVIWLSIYFVIFLFRTFYRCQLVCSDVKLTAKCEPVGIHRKQRDQVIVLSLAPNVHVCIFMKC